MRNSAYLPIFIILFSSCTILNKSELAQDELFAINGEPVIADEFMYVYEKNNFNNDSAFTAEDVEDYFELFINFKLKVAEAKALGLDTTASFINEYTSYKDQLITPYLSEAKEQERLVKEAYERMKYEIDASHILVTVGPSAMPEDTALAYQKILEVYEKATAGAVFEDLALKYSQDPSAKSNKGRLGYFTAFQMVYAFEEAAFTTPVDSVSNIIRSRFGYHVLKVHDKRPFSGKVKVSHIMLRVDPNQADEQAIRDKIFEIHDQIVGGADWNELCQKYSEDQRTRNSGGTLPFITLGQINDDAFENIAFGLQNSGDVSDPIRTKFGWHILRLEEKIGLESFEDLKDEIEERVAKDERSRLSKSLVVGKLKSQNGYDERVDVRDKILENADSSLIAGKWQGIVSKSLLIDTLFQIDEQYYLVAPMINHIVSKQVMRKGISPADYMNELIDSHIDQSLLDFEEEKLIYTNRDFRLLLNEYYEGILLFEIMNQEVWEKAIKDTIGLRSFFESHQESYYWEERAAAAIISSPSKSTIENVSSTLKSEKYQVLKIEIDISESVDIVNNSSLNSLISIFNQYESSSITIKANKQTQQSEIFSKINRHLSNMGISENAIAIDNGEGVQNIIGLTLNSTSKKSLEYLYNKESGLNLQVVEQLFEKGQNPMLDSLTWEEGIYDGIADGSYALIVIDRILDRQPKKLKDVKGLVISDYQNYLEKNWIESLKNSNTVSINKNTLENIKKAYSKRLHSSD